LAQERKTKAHDSAYNTLQQHLRDVLGLGLKDKAQASIRRGLSKAVEKNGQIFVQKDGAEHSIDEVVSNLVGKIEEARKHDSDLSELLGAPREVTLGGNRRLRNSGFWKIVCWYTLWPYYDRAECEKRGYAKI
jgi:hypothetical protein